MDHIIGASWPRSGHHLLVNMLRTYFGSRFGYCEFYSPELDCCRTVPCIRRDRIHLTKNHDFDLTLPQIEGQKYLIQYRDFIPSVVSNYELYLLANPAVPDDTDTFATFASTQFGQHSAFMNRWVNSEFGKTQLMLSYEQLVADPQDSLRQAATWVAPDQPIDEMRIEQAVRQASGQKVKYRKLQSLGSVGVHEARDVTEFRHYSAELFGKLARLKLPREAVRLTFVRLLGREPAPLAYMIFQGLDSVQTLEAALQDSDVYRRRQKAQGHNGDSQ